MMEAQVVMASRLDELYDAVALLTIELQRRDRLITELENQLSLCECVVSDESGFHSLSPPAAAAGGGASAASS
jgi:DNA polymerase sigma